jgi:hypothetical protein
MEAKKEIEKEGYTTIPAVYTPSEIREIIGAIESAHSDNATFRRA